MSSAAPLRIKLLALAVGILLGFVAVEVTLRAMGMGFGNSPMEPDPVLHHVHPSNYAFVQQHPSGELGGFEIEYNAEGRVFRGSKAPAIGPPKATGCRVALMGDSFTEGGQVPFAASFAGKLEEAGRRTLRGPQLRRPLLQPGHLPGAVLDRRADLEANARLRARLRQ